MCVFVCVCGVRGVVCVLCVCGVCVVCVVWCVCVWCVCVCVRVCGVCVCVRVRVCVCGVVLTYLTTVADGLVPTMLLLVLERGRM